MVKIINKALLSGTSKQCQIRYEFQSSTGRWILDPNEYAGALLTVCQVKEIGIEVMTKFPCDKLLTSHYQGVLSKE